jgi:putative SOS response-associated peptidase YedK
MCYYKSQKTSGREIAKALMAPFVLADQFAPINNINGFTHPMTPVLSVDNGRSINLYSWGLIPFWVKDWSTATKLRNQTLNAKSEEVFEKPSFRDSIMKRRCIIPVTSFYEWKHVGKEKIPHEIYPKEQPYFYLAGIYSHWNDPATRDLYSTYSVLTGAANELMTDIHNTKKRQPIMIDEGLINTWIDPGLSKPAVIELMQPCDDSNMAAKIIDYSPATANPND